MVQHDKMTESVPDGTHSAMLIQRLVGTDKLVIYL